MFGSLANTMMDKNFHVVKRNSWDGIFRFAVKSIHDPIQMRAGFLDCDSSLFKSEASEMVIHALEKFQAKSSSCARCSM